MAANDLRRFFAAAPLLAPLITAGSLMAAAVPAAITGNPPGRLAVHIAASDSPGYFEEWASTPFRAAVTIHGIHRIDRGRTALFAFLVTGQSAGRDGRSNVDVDIRVIRPDYTEAYVDSSYAHVSRVEDGRVGFTMADPSLKLGVTQDDPVGPWLVEAVAHDRVSGATASALYPLVVRDQQTPMRETASAGRP